MQMGKLNPERRKKLLTHSKWQNQDLNPGLSITLLRDTDSQHVCMIDSSGSPQVMLARGCIMSSRILFTSL